MCHQCPQTKRSHVISGASLIISKRPFSFRQTSQINLSPISLSVTPLPVELSIRTDTLFERNRRSAKNDGSLELTADWGALLTRKFLPFPIVHLPKKGPAIGNFGIENPLSTTPSQLTNGFKQKPDHNLRFAAPSAPEPQFLHCNRSPCVSRPEYSGFFAQNDKMSLAQSGILHSADSVQKDDLPCAEVS